MTHTHTHTHKNAHTHTWRVPGLIGWLHMFGDVLCKSRARCGQLHGTDSGGRWCVLLAWPLCLAPVGLDRALAVCQESSRVLARNCACVRYVREQTTTIRAVCVRAGGQQGGGMGMGALLRWHRADVDLRRVVGHAVAGPTVPRRGGAAGLGAGCGVAGDEANGRLRSSARLRRCFDC